MEATSLLNDTDPLPEEVISDSDRPHRPAVGAVRDVPVGRRHFGARGRPRRMRSWEAGSYRRFIRPRAGRRSASATSNDIALPRNQRTVDRWFNIEALFERDHRKQLT